MKTLQNQTQNFLSLDRGVICHHVFTPHGIMPLEKPIFSREYVCEFCGCTQGYTPIVDIEISNEKAWLCGNRICDVNTAIKNKKRVSTTPAPPKCSPWALFCEKNGLPDQYSKITFEKVDQPLELVTTFKKFARQPTGILIFMGSPGTGKTFCSVAIAELFCRFRSDVFFTSQKKLHDMWIESFNEQNNINLKYRLEEVGLLIIDDFATKIKSDTFYTLLFDLIDTRMHWSNKGTLLTTNLCIEDFNEFCGEPLMDRFRTANIIKFSSSSKRKRRSF